MQYYDGPEMKRQIETLKQGLIRKTDAYNETSKKREELERTAAYCEEEFGRSRVAFEQNSEVLVEDKERLESEMRGSSRGYRKGWVVEAWMRC